MKVDVSIEEYRTSKSIEIETLAKQCAEQTGQYEHTWHSTHEKLGIELAKLEAKKEALAEIIDNDKTTYKKILEMKEAEILRLTKIVDSLIEKQPSITIQNLKS